MNLCFVIRDDIGMPHADIEGAMIAGFESYSGEPIRDHMLLAAQQYLIRTSQISNLAYS
jgi:hypothetical protein